MAIGVTGIDHAVVAVCDLDGAAAAFARLGFTLTPVAAHAEWGTANRCVMLEPDYIELLAATGSGAPAERVRTACAEGDRPMALALGCGDAAAEVERLRAAGVAVEAPQTLSRPAVGGGTARFSIVPLPDEALAGVPNWLCQHLTPELMRPEGATNHANGALEIVSATAVVAMPDPPPAALVALFGPAAATATDDTVAVHTARGPIFLTRPDDLSHLHPGTEGDDLPAAPGLAVLTIRVSDPVRTAAVLKGNGVAYGRDASGALTVGPEDACGLWLEFVA